MIAFYDSGAGGLTVMRACRALLPEANFLYMADNKNAPYGNLPARRLIAIVEHNCRELIARGATIIVFACNTITAVCIYQMRRTFPEIEFVGAEPAIAPALRHTSGQVLVLATKNTIKNSLHLIKYRHEARVKFYPVKKLARLIDANLENLGAIKNKINRIFAKHRRRRYDAIVLGCTHYNFVKHNILNIFNLTEEACFDGLNGIAQRLKKVAGSAGNGKGGRAEFLFTKENAALREIYRRMI